MFPGFQVLVGLAYVGRKYGERQDEFVQQIKRETDGALEVHEEDGAHAVGVVPNLMVEGVVEDHRTTFFPDEIVFRHPDPAAFTRLGHEQAEVKAENAVVGSAVSRDVFARRKDRKEAGFEPGDVLDDTGGLRAAPQVFFRAFAVADEHECLPMVVALNRFYVARDVLEVGQFFAPLQYHVEFRADLPPFGFHLSDPGEAAGIIDGRIAVNRMGNIAALNPVDESDGETGK